LLVLFGDKEHVRHKRPKNKIHAHFVKQNTEIKKTDSDGRDGRYKLKYVKKRCINAVMKKCLENRRQQPLLGRKVVEPS